MTEATRPRAATVLISCFEKFDSCSSAELDLQDFSRHHVCDGEVQGCCEGHVSHKRGCLWGNAQYISAHATVAFTYGYNYHMLVLSSKQSTHFMYGGIAHARGHPACRQLIVLHHILICREHNHFMCQAVEILFLCSGECAAVH